VFATRRCVAVTYCWHNCGDRAGQGDVGPQPSRPLTGGASAVGAWWRLCEVFTCKKQTAAFETRWLHMHSRVSMPRVIWPRVTVIAALLCCQREVAKVLKRSVWLEVLHQLVNSGRAWLTACPPDKLVYIRGGQTAAREPHAALWHIMCGSLKYVGWAPFCITIHINGK
jgi:hypothetical protein